MSDKRDIPTRAAGFVTQIMTSIGAVGGVLVVLKATEQITWSWVTVLLPWGVTIGFYTLTLIAWAAFRAYNRSRRARR